MGRCNAILALVVRMMFLLHSTLIFAYTATSTRIWWVWLTFGLPSMFILGETFYTLSREDSGIESTIYSTSILFYILSTLPEMCILEVTRINNFLNVTSIFQGSSTELLIPEIDGIIIQLPEDIWLEIIKQSILLVIIIGRWGLPLGRNSDRLQQQELSKLLLVYFFLATDLLELFDCLKDPRVIRAMWLPYAIIGAFFLSLFQFIFVRPMNGTPVGDAMRFTRSPEKRICPSYIADNSDEVHNSRNMLQQETCGCLLSEVSASWLSLVLMDLPFLAIRTYIVVWLYMVEFNVIFFLVKNVITVILTFYHIAVVKCCQ